MGGWVVGWVCRFGTRFVKRTEKMFWVLVVCVVLFLVARRQVLRWLHAERAGAVHSVYKHRNIRPLSAVECALGKLQQEAHLPQTTSCFVYELLPKTTADHVRKAVFLLAQKHQILQVGEIGENT